MRYQNIIKGIFKERPNRFIAYVEIDGKLEIVHVKNTGRCKELLVENAVVYLEKSDNPQRKTAYDLVAVEKGERIINMDSQAPNKVVEEFLKQGQFFTDLILVQQEKTYKKSRFDFYLETNDKKIFIEVKGVTLENEGVVSFPDAPSERAIKHLEELIEAKKEGYDSYVFFVIQMEDVAYFKPNEIRHKAFADTLKRAREEGVFVYCFDCFVTSWELKINKPVPFILSQLDLISKPLLAWYDKGHRTLPWREDKTPYNVWVSEIMLQQTRVEAVKPFFARFMEKLPTIKALSEAPEEELLKVWEGLGYYNRVRNLQIAAKQIMREYQGQMPQEYEQLLSLKGIGSYTAGAISSIAFGKVAPAVDGNVLRVLARLRLDEAKITDEKVKKRIEKELLYSMSTERPGDFNQAMMELGATVCIPNGEPKCKLCPLANICQAKAENKSKEFPKKAEKKGRVIEEKTILLLQDSNLAAISKRPAKGLLAGMYEFPMLEGYKCEEEIIAYLKENGVETIRIKRLEDSKHIFTHKEWHMRGYLIRVDEIEQMKKIKEAKKWLFLEPYIVQESYPIPSAFAAYVPYLDMKLGNKKFEEK